MGSTDHNHQSQEPEGGDRPTVTPKNPIGEASSSGFDFFASIAAGMLIGFGLDWVLDTAPIMVIIGVIAGFVSGFLKLWVASKAIEDEARRRGRL